MVVTKIFAGLGNQLFQYAIGRSVAMKRGAALKLDTSWYDHIPSSNTPRRFLLHNFNIDAEVASGEEIARLRKGTVFNIANRFLPYKNKRYIKEQAIEFEPHVLEAPANVYLEGYWQSHRYFKDIADTIKKEVTLKEPISQKYEDIVKSMNCNDSVAVHIRRGDYVTNPQANQFHGICDLRYYQTALQSMNDKINGPSFFVFSDDIEWARENLNLSSAVFVSDTADLQDYEELMLMSFCKHNIIANSTFSWWGAWLNRNPDKVVIAPERWFADPSLDAKDLLPKSWIKM